MTPDPKKARAEALLNELRERRASREIMAIIELLGIRVEEGKNALLAVAEADDFRRLQGETAAYDKLLKALKREPLNLAQNSSVNV